MPDRCVTSPSSPRSGLSALRTSVADFGADQRGTMAVLGAFALLLGCTFVGVAVDYSRASSSSAGFQQAADAAALAAALAVQKDRSVGVERRKADYDRTAHAVFLANLDEDARAQVTGKELEFINGRKQVRYTYTADVTYAFGGLVGQSSASLGGESVAALPEVAGRVKADIHFLIDTSASMGLAADQDGRDKMKAGTRVDASLGDNDRGEATWDRFGQLTVGKTFEGCQFACHTPTGEIWTRTYGYSEPKKSTLDWALENKIDLRFDAARRAAKQVVDEAEAAEARGADIRFSLTGFHDQAKVALLPTDEMASVRAQLDDLQIGYPYKTTRAYPASVANQPNTNPSDADTFTAFAAKVTEFKNEEPSRRPYIFLVTDGVKAVLAGKAWQGTVSVFPQADCDKLKSVAKVVVLYLKYLEPGEDDTVTKELLKTGSNYARGNLYLSIAPNMSECASDPALFAMADSSAEIHEKMTGLLDEILADAGQDGPLRLTQ